MLVASTILVFDPVWPWSLSGWGVPALLLTVGGLVLLTVLTYLTGQRTRPERYALLLTLRLLAVGVVLLLCLRPAVAELDDAILPSKLIILLDSSESMSLTDELNDKSRWDRARQLLQASGVVERLERLQRQQKVEIVYYQGAEDVGRFDPEGKPLGKRTNMGQWLHALAQLHGQDQRLRGLVLLSDGIDNGTRFPTLEQARRWRGLGCPIQPFGLGSPTTAPKQRDIGFVADRIQPPTLPVPIKHKITVKAEVNAPGFENARVTVRMLLDDKEVPAPHSPQEVTLVKMTGNVIEMTCDAPPTPREYKITLKIDPVSGEVSQINNEISSYVTVTKEGLSVLWVEGKKRLESVWVLKHALARDPRFRVYYAERPKEKEPPPTQADWFDFKRQRYDVIVIGDISASRFAGGDAKVFPEIQEMVQTQRTGLLFLGGYETFGNSDWQNYPDVAGLFPVELAKRGQLEGRASVKVMPTEAGYKGYRVMRLAEDREDNRHIWNNVFLPLDGMTLLGSVRPGATVLATNDDGKPEDKQEPVVVAWQKGTGRVMAFAGDTTYKAWRQNERALAFYEQFWRRALLWLAHQEESQGAVNISLDTRRLPAGSNARQGITVAMKGKTGLPLKNARFQVKVIGPAGDETEVPTLPEQEKERGFYWKTQTPGEYRVVVKGSAIDVDGKEIKDEVAEARFLCYAEDVENARPAADHELLGKIAASSGGRFRLAGERELEKYLDELLQQSVVDSRPKADLWPDWKREPVSGRLDDQLGSLWSSGFLLCFLVFCAVVCTEWYLRRRWQMV